MRRPGPTSRRVGAGQGRAARAGDGFGHEASGCGQARRAEPCLRRRGNGRQARPRLGWNSRARPFRKTGVRSSGTCASSSARPGNSANVRPRPRNGLQTGDERCTYFMSNSLRTKIPTLKLPSGGSVSSSIAKFGGINRRVSACSRGQRRRRPDARRSRSRRDDLIGAFALFSASMAIWSTRSTFGQPISGTGSSGPTAKSGALTIRFLRPEGGGIRRVLCVAIHERDIQISETEDAQQVRRVVAADLHLRIRGLGSNLLPMSGSR